MRGTRQYKVCLCQINTHVVTLLSAWGSQSLRAPGTKEGKHVFKGVVELVL